MKTAAETKLASVVKQLKSMARPAELEGMARFGISTDTRLGLRMPVLRKMGKTIGLDQALSLALWQTGIDEARILAALVGDPVKVTDQQMDTWAEDFNSWDVCDQVCMNLFDKTTLAWKKVRQWSLRKEVFVKRAAFSLIAVLAVHDKKADDQAYIDLLPVIVQGSSDDRNMVKKSVSWALRQIGKRNKALNRIALQSAEEIKARGTKPGRWIASDAIRELTGDAVRKRLGL